MKQGIPTLTPGREYRMLFEQMSNRFGSDLPRSYDAVVSFNDARGRAHELRYRLLRLTWDHVEPLTRGGPNTADNVVTTCGPCNFQKSDCTLEELSLIDPRPGGRPSTLQPAWSGLNGRLNSRPV